MVPNEGFGMHICCTNKIKPIYGLKLVFPNIFGPWKQLSWNASMFRKYVGNCMQSNSQQELVQHQCIHFPSPFLILWEKKKNMHAKQIDKQINQGPFRVSHTWGRVKRKLICVVGAHFCWFGVRVLTVYSYIQENVTIYHSERVETVFPGVCFHGDSVMHHMLSAVRVELDLQRPMRRRRLPQETHGNPCIFKRTVSYRLAAPAMSLNTLGDSGKTSSRAGINIQLSTGWRRIHAWGNGQRGGRILKRNNRKFKGWCQCS